MQFAGNQAWPEKFSRPRTLVWVQIRFHQTYSLLFLCSGLQDCLVMVVGDAAATDGEAPLLLLAAHVVSFA
jgi:hypothetical protein